MTPREPLELTLGLRCGTSSADASLEREEERGEEEEREEGEERDQVQLYSVS